MARKIYLDITGFLLILLWVYAAVSKLAEFDQFRLSMHNQPLPTLLQNSLIYVLPSAELFVSMLLINNRTAGIGLWCSAILLASFSGYIALGLLHYFSRVPCSCGGIFTHITWQAHLVFNLAFLLLTLSALYIDLRERRFQAANQ